MRVNLKDKFRKLKVANPSVKDLRDFGVILGIINALLFGVLFPFFFQFQYPLWPFIISAVLIVCGLVRPKMLRLIYQVWMAIGNCLGWINTRIILGFILILHVCIDIKRRLGILLKIRPFYRMTISFILVILLIENEYRWTAILFTFLYIIFAVQFYLNMFSVEIDQLFRPQNPILDCLVVLLKRVTNALKTE